MSGTATVEVPRDEWERMRAIEKGLVEIKKDLADLREAMLCAIEES
jgi:hypothetical protein